MQLGPAVLPGLGVPHVGVPAEAVHVPEADRGPPVRKQDRDLVDGLGSEGQEVPEHVRVLEVRRRVPFLGVDEVGELHGIAEEEHRGVVPHHVEVALFRVELDSEAPGIALGVRRALLPADRREPREHLRPLSHLGEEPGAGVPRDIVSHLEVPEGAGTLRMNDPLGDALAVEVSEFLDEMDILDEQRPVRSRGGGAQIVVHRLPEIGGELPAILSISHARAPSFSSSCRAFCNSCTIP